MKLRPRRQSTVKGTQEHSGKLAKRFYGPFRILARVGTAAYRLELPAAAKIHSVFHCSLLKPFKGNPTPPHVTSLPTQFINGQPVITPLAILNYRKTADSYEVLVQWKGLSPDDTSWEDWSALCQAYHLEDKVDFHGPWSDTNLTEEAPATGVQKGEETITEETPATGVQKGEETKSKRRIVKPTYLADYV